jgi:transcriptional regulator with XRE-family HTH domain
MNDHSNLPSALLPPRVQALLDARPRAKEAFDKHAAVLAAGRRIRALREAARLTQDQLAKLIDTKQAHISDIERGAGKRGPSVVMLGKIEQACANAAPPPGPTPEALETLVQGVVQRFAKRKLNAIADILRADRSAPAVAEAFVALITERLPNDLMQGISRSDTASAAAMLEVMERLPSSSFRLVHSEADLRDVLAKNGSVVAVLP